MSLGLNYGPLDDMIINRLEAQARRHGIALDHVELLGQTASLALAFIKASEAGDLDHFLSSVDWDAVEARVYV